MHTDIYSALNVSMRAEFHTLPPSSSLANNISPFLLKIFLKFWKLHPKWRQKYPTESHCSQIMFEHYHYWALKISDLPTGLCPTIGITYKSKGLGTQLAIFQLPVYVLYCSPLCPELHDDWFLLLSHTHSRFVIIFVHLFLFTSTL